MIWNILISSNENPVINMMNTTSYLRDALEKWTAWMLAMQSLRLLDTASFEVNLPCSFHDCQSQMIAMIIARG